MSNKKITTIGDIALEAGVSIGTVDRVLHNRKDVSESTRKLVLKIIDESNYRPNIYASMLSQKTTCCIVAIIPYFQKGEYWELVHNGILAAIEDMMNPNIELKTFYYNLFDVDSFSAACKNATDARPKGLFIGPIFKTEATKLIAKMNKEGIPVVYIDSKLPELDYLAYFGMPLRESGYLAADLLVGKKERIRRVVNFNIDRGDAPPNDSMLQRHEGFVRYLKEFQPQCELIDCKISPFDFLHNIQLFDDFFRENPDVNHILTLSSRIHIISDWMVIRGCKGKKTLGYDMLRSNIKALSNGVIDYLICERTDHQAYMAMKTLIEHLILRKTPSKKDNFSSIDILTPYNADYYLPEP